MTHIVATLGVQYTITVVRRVIDLRSHKNRIAYLFRQPLVRTSEKHAFFVDTPSVSPNFFCDFVITTEHARVLYPFNCMFL